MAGRASIVGAAATHVGKVREHNEDAHFLDLERGMFVVCDGMGGHAAGEVASAIAIGALREEWSSDTLTGVADRWLEAGTAATKKQLLDVLRAGVVAAHEAILAEARRDESKTGMGTTLVGAIMVGGELMFAHAGDSRAYLVRDGISMQLTEDHTLLARLLAAGIDVDISGEGARFRSMLTNALGIGEDVKVSTFVVPLADGDRFLLCSDGISEYVRENEIGDVLTKQLTPARGAQRLIELALERGGGDNATAVVVRVLEAGETPQPAEQRTKDDAAIGACALWGKRVTQQQRLRALRIAIPRDHNRDEKLPAHALGDRVAWIVVEGVLVQDGRELGPGALVYPESLLATRESVPLPDRDAHAITRSEVRALAIRADDFRELCDDDNELGEALLESLAAVIAKRKPRLAVHAPGPPVDPRGATDPHLRAVPRRTTEVDDASFPELELPAAELRERAATVPDAPASARSRALAESPIIAPAPQRVSAPLIPVRPSPPLPNRPSPLPQGLSPRSRPSSTTAQPPFRPSPEPGKPTPRLTPIQAQAAATLPPTPAAVPARGPAKALPAGAPRATPPGGSAPIARPEPTALHAFTRALTPPAGTPVTRVERNRMRPPTDPEIEAYLELEADLPPLDGGDPDPESELALRRAFSGALAGEPTSVPSPVDASTTRVLETDDGSELTVTTRDAPEPDAPAPVEPGRNRAITAEDASAVSGVISIPET